MAVPKDWAEPWNGARSTVEPFLISVFGIELDAIWQWLVVHNELGALPSADYNPVIDANAHLDAHRARQCFACAIWSLLLQLWNVAAELYHRRPLRDAIHVARDAQRLTTDFDRLISAQPRAPPDSELSIILTELDTNLRATTKLLDRFSKAALESFSADARATLRGGRRLLNRSCRALHDAGFSYAEIAELIGDHTEGARDRIRMRCKRAGR